MERVDIYVVLYNKYRTIVRKHIIRRAKIEVD